MFDAPGAPAYPPPRNTWEFPPPEVSTHWKWLAVVAGLLGVAAAGSLTVLLLVVGNDDFPGFIEDAELTDTIAEQCRLMTSTVESLPLSGSTPEQAEAITDQNRAIALMVESIRSDNDALIRADAPTEQWLRDWERLADARAVYARRLLRDPAATLSVPRDADGARITERMNGVWLGRTMCEVPQTLASPRTDAFSGV